MPMAKPMVESIVLAVGSGVLLVVLLLLMLLLIIVLILLVCKPWRYFSSHAIRPIKADDLERPLVSEDFCQRNDSSTIICLEGSRNQTQSRFSSPQIQRLAYNQRLQPIASQWTHSDSFVLDIPSEDILVGQTLKRPVETNQFAEEQKHLRKEELNYDSISHVNNDKFTEIVPKYVADQRSVLTLEVISGPSHGLRCSIHSTNTSKLPLTLGRVSPSDLLLKDSEVSGKHAMINWNLNKLKWELIDMGSLNGTLLNSRAVHCPDSVRRHWGDPIELASGDIITLGTTSKILVQVSSQTDGQVPFGIGLASDPMALRRGAKKLPMEDVCYYQWSLRGADQFGLFGVCDGHGGAGAATSASKIMPEAIATILSDSFRMERVLSQRDASDVLKEAFFRTEACINHYYEGCTATVLLVWSDEHANFYLQCANVGDSACIVNIDGKLIKMTEDHRITSHSERMRIQATGEPLKEGETRLCGLNLARMLGDKFLKQQDARFSSEPFISQVVHIQQASRGFALLASDGFWDVISTKKAVQLVRQARERDVMDRENSAEKIASSLLSEARALRTKDNTSIIFLDFDDNGRFNSCLHNQ